MDLAPYTVFGVVASGAIALICFRVALKDERWQTSHKFRYQVMWSLGTLLFVGSLAGYCLGIIATRCRF
jgi:uncharacterized membrane protein YgdD (TMEM256/DUF423 family)